MITGVRFKDNPIRATCGLLALATGVGVNLYTQSNEAALEGWRLVLVDAICGLFGFAGLLLLLRDSEGPMWTKHRTTFVLANLAAAVWLVVTIVDLMLVAYQFSIGNSAGAVALAGIYVLPPLLIMVACAWLPPFLHAKGHENAGLVVAVAALVVSLPLAMLEVFLISG